MPKRFDSDELDRLVLEAMRTLAAQSTRGSIGGKLVRELAPVNGQCVYVRVGIELARVGVISTPTLTSSELAEQYRQLIASMKRLMNKDLLFNHRGGDIQQRSFWVVME